MKKTKEITGGAGGFTMIEVLLAMIIIAMSAVAVITWQKTSWSQTSSTNRLMVVGQVIEKQIEKQRMIIAEHPVANYATFIGNSTITLVDSSVTPRITVKWTIYAADSLKDLYGNNVKNVRKVQIKAGYGSGKNDTLTVVTAISQNF
jgi:prepilin-type N-terminal cleavage/methylation domain-containing protein